MKPTIRQKKTHQKKAQPMQKVVIRFKNLKAIAYFVLARKGDKDNAGGGEQTGKLGREEV
ncbi:MAG: hypothetical protein WDN75_20695 [Bacteroidota bacterium]